MRRQWLIDGRAMGGFSGVRGIGTYLQSLLRAYAELGVADRVTLLTAGTGDGLTPPTGVALGPRLPVLKRRIQPVADHLLVSLALRRVRPALYHAVEWAQPLVAGGVPVVLTVHDLIPFLFPRQYPWVRRERLLALRLARRADAVIVPSAATAADVERMAHVAAERIHVIPHGVDPGFAPASKATMARVRGDVGLGDGGYLLSVGTLDQRKRRDQLAAVVAAVRRRHDVRLVIAGDQGVYARALAAALAEHGIADRTLVVGHTGAADLVALYSSAAALVFPTAYEGFGLPVLEALACGTRVVCYDNSSLPEAGGDAAVLVPDGDVAAMAAAVEAVLGETGEERARNIERGIAHAAGFTWERSARAHLEVYGRVEGRRLQ